MFKVIFLLIVIATILVCLFRGVGHLKASKKRPQGFDRSQAVDAEFQEMEDKNGIEEKSEQSF